MRLSQASLLLCGCGLSSIAAAATFSDVLESQQAQPYEVQIVDCRDSNFYNGWPEMG
ncbi:hypothetical protein [Vibrio furnissii]|nr:hypothetical protein [Vibrio furnissii]MCG6233767.1 hypothetical protein [Vibrio furnissii]MCG6259859.1 hypothetical protein [Vibrio furnissii]